MPFETLSDRQMEQLRSSGCYITPKKQPQAPYRPEPKPVPITPRTGALGEDEFG